MSPNYRPRSLASEVGGPPLKVSAGCRGLFEPIPSNTESKPLLRCLGILSQLKCPEHLFDIRTQQMQGLPGHDELFTKEALESSLGKLLLNCTCVGLRD